MRVSLRRRKGKATGTVSEARAIILAQCVLLSTASIRHHNYQPLEETPLNDHPQLVVQPPNFGAIASLLKKLGKSKASSAGRRLHARISACGYDHDSFLGNSLACMYGSLGCLDDARATFDLIRTPTLHSWNILINVYGQHGRVHEAQAAFDHIPSPDFHSWNTLIKVHAQNGNLDTAESLFKRMPHRDVVSWNTMISAFAQNGRCKEALDVFGLMRLEGMQPNKVTYVCVLDACTSSAALEVGQEVHALAQKSGLEEDVMVGTALVDMYGKCGDLRNAKIVFQKMPHRNTVTWTAMITSLLHNELGNEALAMFYQMQEEGMTPNPCTYVCALDACASLVAFEEGQEVHGAVADNGCDLNVFVTTALVNMYAKCGSLVEVLGVFDKLPDRDTCLWTAIISAFAHNGHGNEALGLYKQMIAKGIQPDDITFICLLGACSSLGIVEEGRHLFGSMKAEHCLEPDEKHVACMIDLLGRAGHLEEAEQLIPGMSCEHAALTWSCLLAACRMHGDVERAVRAGNQCFFLDPEYASAYVGLSNMHAEAIKWYDPPGNPGGLKVAYGSYGG